MSFTYKRQILALAFFMGLISEQRCFGIRFNFGPGISTQTTRNISHLMGAASRTTIGCFMIIKGANLLIKDACTEEEKLTVEEEATSTELVDEQIIETPTNELSNQKQGSKDLPGNYYRKGLGSSLVSAGLFLLTR